MKTIQKEVLKYFGLTEFDKEDLACTNILNAVGVNIADELEMEPDE